MATGVEVSVVLPTYNERASLELLHDRLDMALASYSHEVIIVDDQSPDGTGALVRILALRGPYRLVVRPGRAGLSSAVVDGFRAATGRIIVVMDADGSHPPERLSDLIEPIRTGRAEFVLASRRVPGGTEKGLRAFRWLTSWAATLPARPLTAVRDPMSGFFAVRNDVLDRASLTPTGYKIALEILVKCRPATVVEVPFHFGERLAGESKFGPNVIASYGRHLMRLYRWRLANGRPASTTR
ncbi:MAG: polyprenol monophosphomannose synthase [Thermoplasmata archaeon]|nr:polyprenol monophosphomannose synthase [Thermoplasmata archaeon]